MPELLHFDVHDGVGEYALLVHGFMSSRANWLPNLSALSSVCRPVVVELYGHGRSPSPSDLARYSATAYGEAFEAVRQVVGCERWFVVGHSLGTALALRYVLDHPDRVIGHVLSNSNSAAADESWFAAGAARQEQQAAALESSGTDAVLASPFSPARVRGLSNSQMAEMEADMSRHDPVGLARGLRHTTPTTSSRGRLGENVVPSLLVVGWRETAFEAARDHLASAMPNLEVVDVDSGHAVNIDAADAFNAAVASFVRRVSGGVHQDCPDNLPSPG